jgi:quinoprotein dehydrogenase-associated probable ABC transporter substrate-binding protein
MAKKTVHAGWAAALILVAGFLGLPALAAPAPQPENGGQQTLRVCEDPDNPPFSMRDGSGFENKIAELLAKSLGWKLEYTWFPQRFGFIRHTLRAKDEQGHYKCDLVMGVPPGFDQAATTQPYYRSIYTLVYVKGGKLDGVSSPGDLLKLPPATRDKLRLGTFDQTPPVDWLLKNGMIDRMVPYQKMSSDPKNYPGRLLQEDLGKGKLDGAFIWGPIAGYFAKKITAEKLVVVPFKPEPDIKFNFSIAMGVRFGEKAWQKEVGELIKKNQSGINEILTEYGVPLVDAHGNLMN